MERIVVFSCTNRPDSNTLKVSKIYLRMLQELNCKAALLDFRQLPHDLAYSEMFGKRTEAYAKLVTEFVSSCRKFVFVVPEYNGSFPGILKSFLDSVHPREWADKDACLVGLADGRAGNLRGMDHLTGIFNYLKMHVYHNKLPISVINKVIGPEGDFVDPEQTRVSKLQLEGFINF